MKALAKWSIRNSVAVNLIMLFIITAGVLTVLSMRREMFPQFALDMIHIGVDYPGASPEEVEEGICIKIEEQIEGIEGISRIVSTAYEGSGSVLAELESNSDIARIMDEIEAEVDRIDTFPEEAEEPVVTEILKRDPTISVAVYGHVSEKMLRRLAEGVRDDLLEAEPAPPPSAGGFSGLLQRITTALTFKQPDRITQIDLIGVRDYEIAIEVSEENLRRYGLSFDHIARAVRRGSVDLPGGTIKTKQGEVLVRAKGQLYRGTEFEKIPLITLADGTLIRLGEVATVRDEFRDQDIKTRFNGKPAAVVRVNRTSEQDVIEIARIVKQYAKQRQGSLPEGVSIATWGDLSGMVQERIDLLLSNGVQGILLVFIVLALFLNFRLAFWVSFGIPISFMGAFWALDALGQTINMISLFAFIMTLGILVDDAIIVGENVYSHYSRGKKPQTSVVDGLKEVGGPVVMAVTTTMVAFAPLLFIAGITGKFIAVMPMAVIAILAVSLFEALVILPSHLNHALIRSERRHSRFIDAHERLRAGVESALNWVIERLYEPAIRYVIKNRYFTLAIGMGVLIVSLGVVIGGYVPFVFFPKGESDWIVADVSYPLGAPFAITENTVARIESKAFALNDEFAEFSHRNGDLVRNAFSLVGLIPRRDWKPPEFGNHVGEIWIELVSSEERGDISTNRILSRWRESIGDIPGVESLTFATLEGGPAGNPIEIQLSGTDFEMLQKAADELKQEIAGYQGTLDITDNFKPGKQEKVIRIREGARSLGITMQDVARQVRQAFYGEEALRIQRGRDDIRVLVRYADSERRSLAGIEEMRIRSPEGHEIPIEEVAIVTQGQAYSVINRVDRKRTITVISDIDEAVGNASEIVADLKANFLPALMNRYPGIAYDLEGQEKRTQESLDSLKRGYTLAMMGIFLLLAYQFRSYIQPVIIMVAIPFGLVGAIAGHLLLGMQFTMISVFGVVALSGIVVNDSLILIDFINRAERSGIDVQTAVVQSGKSRFRPVMLTSVTTVAGLFPLLLESSFQAQFLIPMAVSISFGLMAATVLTLLFVPTLFLIVRDVSSLLGGRQIGRTGEESGAGRSAAAQSPQPRS
jgi:multidrug efflux pump subunit AcrB